MIATMGSSDSPAPINAISVLHLIGLNWVPQPPEREGLPRSFHDLEHMPPRITPEGRMSAHTNFFLIRGRVQHVRVTPHLRLGDDA